MNIAVRYYSRSGSTRKIAEAIADALGVKALSIEQPLTGPVDLLFLGGAPYVGGALDKNLQAFIQTLTSTQVKSIAAFSTSNWKGSIRQKIEKSLQDKSIKVLDEEFVCRGAFVISGNRPNKQDCARAIVFAKEQLKRSAK